MRQCCFSNINRNSNIKSNTYKDRVYINSDFWNNKDKDSVVIQAFCPVDGPGKYRIEMLYNDILVLSVSTEVLP